MQQHSFTSFTSRVSNCYIVYNNTYFNINRHTDGYIHILSDARGDLWSNADRCAYPNADRYTHILPGPNADSRSNADRYTHILSGANGDPRSNADRYTHILSGANADTRRYAGANADRYTDAIRQFRENM